ncbi:hypothetical protein I8J29_07130 [Paenibacillus sp. MWE-103]|uniref:Uncharacterized protein n=2 Tax=Paenibacillus TaxID=44249 RepID=A0ABS3W6P1_9BACL|nr:hypothetical protein [Paenibacillus artemisiicola]MBO7743958.1 hypothetical protein [Paenibacillus artemisiicola]SFI58590.1 hypothetical protein SAMN02799624_01502 [Paenibacillus sp. UNC496MF]
MYWQQLWFVSNMIFVALAIVYLFMHRSVTLARQEADAPRLARTKKRRLTSAVLCLASFAAMVAFFLINMRVNG